MKEKQDNEAIIREVCKEVFKAILEFIYTYSIELTWKMCLE